MAEVRVTISTITERGVFPQFYQDFRHECLADDYAQMFRKLAAQAGVMVRIDRTAVG